MRECMKKKSMLWMLALVILLGSLAFGTTEVQAAEPGWQQENGAWYYYDDATTKHMGWLDYCNIYGQACRYYMKAAEGGAMATGWINIDGLYYVNCCCFSCSIGFVDSIVLNVCFSYSEEK